MCSKPFFVPWVYMPGQWQSITAGLPADDARRPALLEMAAQHAAAGLVGVSGEHYAGAHWLGSFAVYLATARGLTAAAR